jgi:hypothetical protein
MFRKFGICSLFKSNLAANSFLCGIREHIFFQSEIIDDSIFFLRLFFVLPVTFLFGHQKSYVSYEIITVYFVLDKAKWDSLNRLCLTKASYFYY